MITLLHLLSYAGGLAAFLFVTLSLASGLLWLAELIEEHSRHAKIIGIRAIYVIIVLHLLLIFTDGLPSLPILFSIFCHLIYLSNFSSSWPFIALTSPKFLLSCVLVVADHFLWFFHFAAKAQEAKKYRGPKYRYGGSAIKGEEGLAFIDVAAFFAICVWFVPLYLFLSLSANDNALPSLAPGSSSPSRPGTLDLSALDLSTPGENPRTHKATRQRTSTSLVKSLLVPLVSYLPLPRLRSRNKPNDEGILTPRTPIRGSPLHSPVKMPKSYFPWSDDLAATASGSNSTSNSLNPESAAAGSRGWPSGMRTPPPPRRVQSEAQVQSVNPRGIAMRNGKVHTTDEELAMTSEPDASATEEGTGVPSRPASTTPPSSMMGNGPKMSLGPSGRIPMGDAQVVQAGWDSGSGGVGLVKRKAD